MLSEAKHLHPPVVGAIPERSRRDSSRSLPKPRNDIGVLVGNFGQAPGAISTSFRATKHERPGAWCIRTSAGACSEPKGAAVPPGFARLSRGAGPSWDDAEIVSSATLARSRGPIGRAYSFNPELSAGGSRVIFAAVRARGSHSPPVAPARCRGYSSLSQPVLQLVTCARGIDQIGLARVVYSFGPGVPPFETGPPWAASPQGYGDEGTALLRSLTTCRPAAGSRTKPLTSGQASRRMRFPGSSDRQKN
jgi:hypothetical protein